MSILEQLVKPNKRLLFITIFSALSSILFIVFFSYLLNYAQNLSENKAILLTLGLLSLEFQLILTIYSVIFYFVPGTEQSIELRERAKFTYLWTTYLGFVFIAPLLSLRSYLLSGGNKNHILRAKKEYEESQAIIFTELALEDKNIKLSKEALMKIENAKILNNEGFITSEEKASYLWEILNEETSIFKDKINYSNPEVIKKISDIIETF